MVRSLLKTRVSPQGIPGGAPCTARSPAHMHDTPWNQAPGCPLTVDPEASGSQAEQLRPKAHPPGGRCPPRALQMPAPRSQQRGGGRRRQAGRHYLGLRQGFPLPGWFFAGMARGREKGSEKGPLGMPHTPQRQQTPASATQSPNQGGLFEAVNGRMFTQGVPEQDHVTDPSQCPWFLGPQMDTTQNPPAKE